jgi:hypothetical protein
MHACELGGFLFWVLTKRIFLLYTHAEYCGVRFAHALFEIAQSSCAMTSGGVVQ